MDSSKNEKRLSSFNNSASQEEFDTSIRTEEQLEWNTDDEHRARTKYT